MRIRSWLAMASVALGAAGCARVSVHEPPADGGVADAGPAIGAGEDGGAEDAGVSPADAAPPGPASCAWQRAPSDWPTFGEHTATLLADGRVLVVGSTRECAGIRCPTAPGALFDPVTGAWTLLHDAPPPVSGRTATLLADHRVLLAGGVDEHGQVLSAAFGFCPSAARFFPVPDLITARAYHASVVLSDGRVVVAGGRSGGSGSAADLLSSVELFDPVAHRWTAARPMLGPRERHTATVLGAQVAVVGGVGVIEGIPRVVPDTELYDSAADAWSLFDSLPGGAVGHTTTALGVGGSLLVVSNGGAFAKSWHSGWEPAATMQFPRSNHVAARLRDGRVLVAGGTPYQILLTPEIYDPGTRTWTTTCDQPVEIWDGSATLLGDDRVLVISGEALLFELVPPAGGATP